MKRFLDFLMALGDLLMPRECLACGRRLGVRERHLCLSCAADVPYTRFWLAPHNPLADRFNAVLERHRGTEPMDYAYAAALMYYKGVYRSIPRALKYHGDLAAGRHYGALLGRRLASAPHFEDIDLVIPVPLHWTRRRSRGYNQAEILARALVDALHAEVRTDLLVRARRTRSQTRVSVDQKAQNVASAFQVPERFPLWARLLWFVRRVRSAILSRFARALVRAGHDGSCPSSQNAFAPSERFASWLLSRSKPSKASPESPATVLASAHHILLVDDTFTTGATLYACYAALRPYTSARISIATLAAVEGNPSAGP